MTTYALGASYSPAGLTAASALAINGGGEVVITGTSGKLFVLSNAGTLLRTNSLGGTASPSAVSVDLSGNVWVTNSAANTVQEALGAAAPTLPLAQAVQSGSAGQRP